MIHNTLFLPRCHLIDVYEALAISSTSTCLLFAVHLVWDKNNSCTLPSKETTHFPADLRSVLCCSQPQQCIVINAPIMLRHDSPILFLAPRPFLALTMSTTNTDSSGGDRKRERSPSPKHSLSWKEELTYCRSSTEPLPMSGSDGNAALISSRHNFQRS